MVRPTAVVSVGLALILVPLGTLAACTVRWCWTLAAKVRR